MIVTAIIKFFIVGIAAILSFVPDVTELPMIDSYVSTGFNYFRYLGQLFPPFILFIQLTGFYLTYRSIMLVTKVMLAHRTPTLE